jgi:hypothetical protein
MTNPIKNILPQGLVGFLFFLVFAGCGPTFDPASLINDTRVVGARIEVEGAPDRASPKPGETANVTWLVTSPDTTPSLGWTFAVCTPATGKSSPACLQAPLVRFDGAASPPRISIPVPSQSVLGGATILMLYGGICAGVDPMPQFDPQNGLVSCPAGSRGTTVSLDIPLQLGDDANHSPIANRAFTLDGAAWSAPASSDDPCVQGPRVTAGSKDHVIGETTHDSDRESYTVVRGDPPVATATRESLQISQLTTAGKLKSQFSFVEATDESASTIVDVTWNAPEGAEVPAGGTRVTFTFVVRDDRGGTDWTTRNLCVTP